MKKNNMIKLTKKKETMTHKNNDPFGFNKAINYNVLDNPKTLNEIAKIFGIEEKTEAPNISYKKAVNSLKRKLK